MKLIVTNKIPENPEFCPEKEGWKPLKEPKSVLVTMLIASPVGLLMCFIVLAIANLMGNTVDMELNFSVILALFIIIPIHELLHALAFPESIKSDKVIFGVLPKAGACFAHYEGEMKKKSFLISLLAPLLGISVIPLVLLCVTHIKFPFLVTVSAVNALCSCVDLFGFFLILFQIPKASIIRNKGFKTYWKQL